MAGLTSGLSANAVKTALDKVFYGGYDYEVQPGLARASDPLAFVQDSADNAAVIIEQYGGPGYFDVRSEKQNVPGATPLVSNQQTFSVVNYSKKTDISKNFFDDDQHSVVMRTIDRMGRNAGLSQDKNAMNQYNLGFTTVTTNDSVALFSNSHTTLDGTTVDNLETGALTEANLETLVNSLLGQVTQDGTVGGFVPACLLVPNTLFKEAMEITKSELRSSSADNDLNYYSQVYPGLQVKQSVFLNGNNNGSDTAYFLMSQNHSMYRWVRQGLETALVDWRYQPNNDYIYKAEYREVVGPISYEGIVGSNGTA